MAGIFDKFLIEEEDEEETRRNLFARFAPEPKRKSLVTGDPMQTFGNVVGETIKNIPKSTVKLLEDVWGAVSSPIETSKAVGELAQGVGNKLGRKAAEMSFGQDMEPMPERSELAADVAGQAIKDRYGSLDALTNTITQDPAGFALDATGFGGPLGKMEPLGVMGRTAQKAGKPTANKLYRSAAGIEPSSLGRGEDIANTGMRFQDEPSGFMRRLLPEAKGMSVGRGGLKELQDMQKQIGNRMNKIIDDAKASEFGQSKFQLVPRTVITKPIDDLIKKSELHANPKYATKLKKMKADFEAQFGDKKNLFPDELQKWKTQAYDEGYALGKDPTTKVTDPRIKGYREMARGAKKALDKELPALRKPNNQWADLKTLEPYIKDAIDSMPDELMAKVARKTVDHPWVKSNMARALDAVSRGDMGLLEKHLNSHEIRALLALAGRTKEEMEDELVF